MSIRQNKQPSISKPLILLTLSHMVTDLSQGALPVLLPFLKNIFNLTYTQVGFIVLMQNITSSVIQPVFGFITDKISLPRLLPLSILLSGIGMAACGLADSYHMLLLAVIVSGMGVAGFHPQASKSTHFISDVAEKGRNMGIFSFGGNLGMALGSLFMTFLLTLPGITSNTIFFAIPALIVAVILWLSLSLFSHQPVSHTSATQTVTMRQSLKLLPLIILLTFIFIRSTIHAGLSTYIPLYYINYLSGSPIFASYLLSAFLFCGVLGTLLGGILSDRLGRKTVIISSMLITLPLMNLLPYSTGIFTVLLLAALGFILVSSFSTTIVLAQEMMPGYVGTVSGLTIGFTIGLGGVGVTLLGYVADYSGVPSVFTVLALLPFIGIAMAALLPKDPA